MCLLGRQKNYKIEKNISIHKWKCFDTKLSIMFFPLYVIFHSIKKDPKIKFHTYFRFDRSFISCLNIWSFKSSLCSNAKIFGHKWHLKWSECILIMWSCRIFSVVKLVEQWEQANGLSVPRTKKKIIYHTSIYLTNHNV